MPKNFPFLSLLLFTAMMLAACTAAPRPQKRPPRRLRLKKRLSI